MPVMGEPDASVLLEAAVEPSEITPSVDLDTSGLSINDATMEAWVSVIEALSDTRAVGLVADPFDIEPGTDLRALNIVLGAGIGTFVDNELDGPPGSACVVLYVSEPMALQTAIDYTAAAFGVDALTAEDAYIRVVPTGPVDLLSHRFKMRPAPGGVSVAHRRVAAGTLGCLCTGRNEPRNQRTLILSNNHVLADLNRGHAGDHIFQPGPHDGGTRHANRIGILERFVNIHIEGQNHVDCGTAWVDQNDVRRDLVYLKQGVPQYFSLSLPTAPARIGMAVGKSGRTTQLTVGRVDAIGVTIRVNMGGGQVAQFANQISIQGLTGNFSQRGDSGSLVWTWDNNRQPVGLLFAGGNGVTFANPIDAVLNALDVNLLV